MQTHRFISVKISSSLPLDKMASFFEMSTPSRRDNYIMLEGDRLSLLLKYSSPTKQVYFFRFGVATFLNFSESEIRIFLRYISSIVRISDINLFTRYYGSHVIKVDDSSRCRLWENDNNPLPYHDYILPIAAEVLAKSTSLRKIEDDVSALLDDAEKLVFYLQNAKLSPNTRKFSKIVSRLLRLEFDSVNNIKIYDRSNSINRGMHSREIYSRFLEHYEFHHRFNNLENKTDSLRGIARSYASLGYNQAEMRLYTLEIFLLFLFLLAYLV